MKMSLNETNRKVGISKYYSDAFPVQNGLKEGDLRSPLLFNCLRTAIRKFQGNRKRLK
jgi:hypothetical protein